MALYIELNNIVSNHENIKINISKITISSIIDPDNLLSAYSGVWHDAASYYYEKNGRELVGNIQIWLRNQGDNKNYGIIISSNISAKSESENSGKSLLCKTVQYLYDYTKENPKLNPSNFEGYTDFIFPNFYYSKEMFTTFPD